MRFIIQAQPLRTRTVSNVLEFISMLDPDKRYEIHIEEAKTRLPGNLQARISILIRELAQFCGYSEAQMKSLIKKEFYPTETISVKLKDGSTKFATVPVRTMNLNPKQAREVEAHIYDLAGEIPGCVLSIPQATE